LFSYLETGEKAALRRRSWFCFNLKRGIEQARIAKMEEQSISRQLKIFSDGGARSNPGPAAIAFIILSDKGHILMTKSRYIGLRTNNQAEYEALIVALEAAVELHAEEVVCHLDSELVAKQLTGEYTVRNSELRKLWKKVKELNKHFKKVSFISVSRTNIEIQKADALVNEALDEESRRHIGGRKLKF
jgi:ribonuclease HI